MTPRLDIIAPVGACSSLLATVLLRAKGAYPSLYVLADIAGRCVLAADGNRGEIHVRSFAYRGGDWTVRTVGLTARTALGVLLDVETLVRACGMRGAA